MSREHLSQLINGEIFAAEAEVADGVIVRTEEPAPLGKRFTCATIMSREGKDVSATGEATTDDGTAVHLGCGAQVLVTLSGGGSISCCNMPMIPENPKPLPSAD